MTDELVDIIDVSDHIIGQAMKSEAHAKGLLHRVVIAEIINQKREWMLILQAEDRQDPGQYVSPVGGHVRAGETGIDALRREVQEEVGILVNEFEFVGKDIFNRTVRGRQGHHLFMLYRIFADEEPKLNAESVSFKRFSEQDLKHNLEENAALFGNAFIFVVNTFFPELLT